MLTKPDAGWTYFSLGEECYSLSYLWDLPLPWLKEAIKGIETLQPFIVYGYCEPGHFSCRVDLHKCHITAELESEEVNDEMDAVTETVQVDMVKFCEILYEDLNKHLLEWAKWSSWTVDNNHPEVMKKMEEIQENLNHLSKLIHIRKGEI